MVWSWSRSRMTRSRSRMMRPRLHHWYKQCQGNSISPPWLDPEPWVSDIAKTKFHQGSRAHPIILVSNWTLQICSLIQSPPHHQSVQFTRWWPPRLPLVPSNHHQIIPCTFWITSRGNMVDKKITNLPMCVAQKCWSTNRLVWLWGLHPPSLKWAELWYTNIFKGIFRTF